MTGHLSSKILGRSQDQDFFDKNASRIVEGEILERLETKPCHATV